MSSLSLYLGAALEDTEGLPEKLSGLGRVLSENEDLAGIGLLLIDFGAQAEDLRGRIAFAQEKLAESTEGNQ